MKRANSQSQHLLPGIWTCEGPRRRRLISLKYLSLVVLVVQNSTLVLLLRHSRTAHQRGRPQYLASVAVVVMELIKFTICWIVVAVHRRSISSAAMIFRKELMSKDTLQMAIPAGIYAVQNNLLYTALSNLDAATFQLTYQIKLLTTALFAVILLGKSLSRIKWTSLMMLLLGVVMVQLTAGDHAGRQNASARKQNYWVGLSAVLASAISSGFASCYFEKLLKNNKSSMWIRNMQLGTFAFLFSSIHMALVDGTAILRNGFLQGFDSITWSVVLNQALGGLLVSLVVKYADSIVKGFATSISIVLSSVITAFCSGLIPSGQHLVGASVVIAAVALYSI